MSPPLAVTGAGVVTAAGRGVGPAWDALRAGRSFLAPDGDPRLAGFGPPATARCAPLDPEALGADRRAARIMGRHTHMLLASVADALAEAGLAGRGCPGEEVAFFAGMDSVDPDEADLMPAVDASRGGEGGLDYARFFSRGMDAIPPLWPLGTLNAIGFSQVAIQFGLRGENAVFSPGPEAALQAVAEAADALRGARCRLALAAGVSLVVGHRAVARCLGRGLLRPGGGPLRPFAGEEGLGLGEGAATLALELLEAARTQGRPLRGLVRGCGSARALGGEEGLARAFRAAAEAALGRAGVEAGRVDLVVAHGEGRPAADRAEGEALAGLFGGRRPLGLATKGAFGHLLGGAPAVDLILALRCLEEGFVPPSPGAGRDADGALRFPGPAGEAARLRFALVMCRGFDDVCGAIVAEAARPGPPGPA